MPIFDYQCQGCGHRFDVLQKAGEGALRKCPECGKLKLRKALSAPSFHLKGSGWYKTDFRDKNAAKEKSDGKGAAKAESKAGHTMDTAKEHSHSNDHGGDGGGHSHGGHTHTHGGSTHSHGPGCGHKH